MMQDMIQDIINMQMRIRSMQQTRELAIVITKLDEARHWLFDHMSIEHQKSEMMKQQLLQGGGLINA